MGGLALLPVARQAWLCALHAPMKMNRLGFLIRKMNRLGFLQSC